MKEELSETAKAVQEVAKTSGKALDVAQQVGQFVSRYADASLKEAFGIFEDKLKYMRWERQARYIRKANELLCELGLEAPSRPVPLRLMIPLLEAASLEDNDYLQDLWARLLVNFACQSSGVEPSRSFIDILERLSPLQVQTLDVIYRIPFEDMQHNGVETKDLPRSARALPEKKSKVEIVEPPDHIKLALSDLDRLGCIAVARSWGGGQLFGYVNPTLLGKAFVQACTLPPSRLTSARADGANDKEGAQ